LADALERDGVAAVAEFAAELPPFTLAPHRAAIDRCFGAETIAAVLSALHAEDTDWARETLAILDRMSPSSMHWSFEIIRNGALRTLAQCLEAELALVKRVTGHPDFAEGVRAMVVDKDRSPRWVPLSGPDFRTA
jgi:enoyl-CoA hydratase